MTACYCLLLLFLVSAGLAHTVQASIFCTSDPCVKNCTNCDMGQKVADPTDCHHYYECDGSGDFLNTLPLQCPPGEVYNSGKHKCDPTATCTHCTQGCFYDCTHTENPKISYPFDCKVYHECDATSDNPGPALPCPPDMPFFDGMNCQKDKSKCCHCHGYCYDADVGSVVPDPKDCRNYYSCIFPGLPSSSGTCIPGTFFENSDCSSSATCNTQCKNVIGGDGCIDPYTCVEVGYFPKCPSKCMPQYYYCSQISDTYVQSESCPDGYVFHPDIQVCVQDNMCPY